MAAIPRGMVLVLDILVDDDADAAVVAPVELFLPESAAAPPEVAVSTDAAAVPYTRI